MKQDERKEGLKAQQKFLKDDLNERLYEAQRIKQYGSSPAVTVNPQGQAIASRGRNNTSENIQPINNPAIEMPEEKIDNYTYIPSQECKIPHIINNNSIDNYNYIPSQECTIKTDTEKQKRYIPSQTAANIQKTFDNSGIQGVLDRAQRAEDQALRVLAGNFDGMV